MRDTKNNSGGYREKVRTLRQDTEVQVEETKTGKVGDSRERKVFGGWVGLGEYCHT